MTLRLITLRPNLAPRCHRSERCSVPNAATALYHPEAKSRFQMPDVPGLLLSCGWATAVAAASRLVTLFFGRTVSRKWYQVVRACDHCQPLFLFATAQTKQTTADDRPDWSEATTNSVSSSSVPPPMPVIHLQFELRRLRTPLARLLRSLEIRSLTLRITTLRPIALPNVTKWDKGSGAVRVISIKKVQGNTRRHWETRTEVCISSFFFLI